MPISFGSGVPALANCAAMYCFSSALTVSQYRYSSSDDLLEHCRSAPYANVVSEALGIERVGGRESSRSRFTVPQLLHCKRRTSDPKVHAPIATEQVARWPESLDSTNPCEPDRSTHRLLF